MNDFSLHLQTENKCVLNLPDPLLQSVSALPNTVVYVLQYHTEQLTGGFSLEEEVVLQPVVLYQTQRTICPSDFSLFFFSFVLISCVTIHA